MHHTNMLDPARTILVIIDMQEAFRTSINDFAEVAARIALVSQAAGRLNVPIIITEQYPKGLGRTAGEITAALPESINPIEKTSFSSCGASGFLEHLENVGARQVLLCGIEAHVCVNQTTHDLLAGNFQVHLLTDCITARHPSNKQIALNKMQQSGALLTSTEMALFELMRDAQHKEFKAIQKLIK